MKKTGLYIILLTTLTLAGYNPSAAQEGQGGNIPLEYSHVDSRFSLVNLSYFKRLSNKFMTLNVSFELHNHTTSDINLKAFLIAFRRVDSVDQRMRKFIEYPKWRKVDIDKNAQKNILLDSVPPIDKTKVDSTIDDITIYPEYQKYIQYILKNPDMGKDIVLPGFDSKAHMDGGSKEFYVANYPLKANVFAQLKVPYNQQNQFFNYVGVVLVDPATKKIVSSKLVYFRKDFKAN